MGSSSLRTSYHPVGLTQYRGDVRTFGVGQRLDVRGLCNREVTQFRFPGPDQISGRPAAPTGESGGANARISQNNSGAR